MAPNTVRGVLTDFVAQVTDLHPDVTRLVTQHHVDADASACARVRERGVIQRRQPRPVVIEADQVPAVGGRDRTRRSPPGP
jgi:hypothetical protein